ncbi:MAG: hypothetical protein GY737_16250 [Desulfobacteraceae bacterium]|nr:hypothetical protein [Desulfobacteraceae bacterium]
MLDKIFKYSKSNSSFDIYSLRGDPSLLKQGQDNRYYRMCTSDKDFRVGFQKYNNDNRLFLSIAVGREQYVPTVEFAQSAIFALSQKTLQNCKNRTGEVIKKSWEIEMNCESIDCLFSLQEVLLSYFETKI